MLRHIIKILILTTSVSLCMQGCAPPKPHPAVVAYQELLSALMMGDPSRVWSLLSSESQALILKRLQGEPAEKAMADAPPPQLKVELNWAFESPFTARPALAPHVVSDTSVIKTQDPSRFQEVRVFYASQSWLIPVIVEEEAWRVHLLGARPALAAHPSTPYR